ncbi:hypothetical protein EMCG_00062 [[Emmonsia] crescens]|uniref:Uncharacterized protein n=1 Tax=[Emmonsia] crescens TaxID=73230 RepID=A0A0G2JCA5_9EURO|nr:hypothetical protein EMCG_00062 [Emmonsia crescens UAMH 3008]
MAMAAASKTLLRDMFNVFEDPRLNILGVPRTGIVKFEVRIPLRVDFLVQVSSVSNTPNVVKCPALNLKASYTFDEATIFGLSEDYNSDNIL